MNQKKNRKKVIKKFHVEKINSLSGLIVVPEKSKLGPYNNFSLQNKQEYSHFEYKPMTNFDCINIDQNYFFRQEFISWHLENTTNILNELQCDCKISKPHFSQ